MDCPSLDQLRPRALHWALFGAPEYSRRLLVSAWAGHETDLSATCLASWRERIDRMLQTAGPHPAPDRMAVGRLFTQLALMDNIANADLELAASVDVRSDPETNPFSFPPTRRFGSSADTFWTTWQRQRCRSSTCVAQLLHRLQRGRGPLDPLPSLTVRLDRNGPHSLRTPTLPPTFVPLTPPPATQTTTIECCCPVHAFVAVSDAVLTWALQTHRRRFAADGRVMRRDAW